MKRKSKRQLVLGVSFLLLFVLFTVSLKFADVQPIGPMGSCVAYAGVNEAVHKLFGVNMILYTVTDWMGIAAILIAAIFAIMGLMQWIKRKSIIKVDRSILLLGGYYVFVFGTYASFEFCVINYRPVLINGILEASYPSSTTTLIMCITLTAMMQFDRLIKNNVFRNTVKTMCVLFTVFTVIGRLISGVHWFTDILGGVLFSVAMVSFYRFALSITEQKAG